MLTASIMYWSLQQSTDESESSPSPSSVSATPEASPAPSVNGDEDSSISMTGSAAEIFNLSIDDAASDTTVSSIQENNNDAGLQ